MKLQAASNRQQTLLRKLNRKKYRYEKELFLIEGARAVQQIIENDILKIEVLFFDEVQEYWLQLPWSEISEKISSYTLDGELFREVSDTDTPQGVLAMCEMPAEKNVESMASEDGIILAFDAIQDPGNLGTVIRTACWFDAKGMISGKGTVDLFHPKVVRSTAGATGVISHMNGDLTDLLINFEKEGWSVFLLEAGEGAVHLRNCNFPSKSILVVGNEANGVRSELIKGSRKRMKISSPVRRPQVESLNAAVATSIALFDLSNKISQ